MIYAQQRRRKGGTIYLRYAHRARHRRAHITRLAFSAINKKNDKQNENKKREKNDSAAARSF